MALIEIVGWTGASMVLIAYFGVSTKRMTASGWQYHAANVVGAVLLVINSTFYGVWPSVALNGIWVAIGIAALLKSSTTSPAERKAKAQAEGETE